MNSLEVISQINNHTEQHTNQIPFDSLVNHPDLIPSFSPRKWFFSKNFSENIELVTEAKRFIPLECYYQINVYFNENELILIRNHSLNKAWNDLRVFLLTPIEYRISKKWKDENVKQFFRYNPEEYESWMELISIFHNEFKSIVENDSNNLLKIIKELRDFYDFWVRNLKDEALKGLDSLDNFLNPPLIMTSNLLEDGKFYTISHQVSNLLINNNKSFALTSDKIKVRFKSIRVDNIVDLNSIHKIYAFYKVLNIPIPASGLVVITYQDNDRKKAKPLLFAVSEDVEGVNAELMIEKLPHNFSFGQQVIGALISIRKDEELSNFIYSARYETLIPINNENVLNYSLDEVNSNKIFAEFKSPLFTVSMIEEQFHETFHSSLGHREAPMIILEWINEINRLNLSYYYLLDQIQLQLFVQRFIKDDVISNDKNLKVESLTFLNSVSLPIKADADIIFLTKNTQNIIQSLRRTNRISYQEILKNIDPQVASYYKELRSKYGSPKKCWEMLKSISNKSQQKTAITIEIQGIKPTIIVNQILENYSRITNKIENESFKNYKTTILENFYQDTLELEKQNKLQLLPKNLKIVLEAWKNGKLFQRDAYEKDIWESIWNKFSKHNPALKFFQNI